MVDLHNLKDWLKAIRWRFFTAAIVPIALGAVIAWNETGQLNWLKFFLSLLGGIFVHAGLNLCNDYFDHVSGNDEVNSNPTPFSGGSRVIQNNLIPARKILYASVLCFIAGGIIGLYLNHASSGNIVLAAGILGFMLSVFYTAPPLKLGYRSAGEIFVGLGFGPLMVTGSYYVQKQSLSMSPVWASIPVGILIAMVLYINEFPDYVADASVSKKTVVVTLGRQRAMRMFPVILLSSYLVTFVGVVLKFIPLSTLIVFLTLPLAFRVINILKINYQKIYELLPANAGMVKLHLFFGLLLSISYLLDKIIKIPK